MAVATNLEGIMGYFNDRVGFLYSRDLGRVFVGFREAKLTETPLAGEWFRFSACRLNAEQQVQKDVFYDAFKAEKIASKLQVVKRTQDGVELELVACCGAVWDGHAYLWNEHLGKLAYSGPKLDCLAPAEMVAVRVRWKQQMSKSCYWIVTSVLGASEAKRPPELRVVTAEATSSTLKVAPHNGPETLRLTDTESHETLLVVSGDWYRPIGNFGDVAVRNEGCFAAGRRFTVCAAPRALHQVMCKVIYCSPNDVHKEYATTSAPKVAPERQPNDGRKLWIGSLPLETTSYDLKALFSKFGAIEDIYVGNAGQRFTDRKFAFVVFVSANSGNECLAAAPFRFKNRQLIVELCRPDTRKLTADPANSPLFSSPRSSVEHYRPDSRKSVSDPANSPLIASRRSSVGAADLNDFSTNWALGARMPTAEKDVQTEGASHESAAELKRKTKSILKRLMELDGVSLALAKMRPDLLKDIILFMASD